MSEITKIPCPECDIMVLFEDLCTCEHPEDCLIEHHKYFFCKKCGQVDVNFEDAI